MALKIYSEANPSSDYSTEGLFTSPVLVLADGKYGTVYQKLLYVRNDSALVFYTNTTVLTIDTTDADYVDGTLDITWKLSEGNTQPTDEEWDAITTGNTISLDDFGSSGNPDTSTYLPFWLRVETPRNVEVQTVLHVQLKISTTEAAA